MSEEMTQRDRRSLDSVGARLEWAAHCDKCRSDEFDCLQWLLLQDPEELAAAKKIAIAKFDFVNGGSLIGIVIGPIAATEGQAEPDDPAKWSTVLRYFTRYELEKMRDEVQVPKDIYVPCEATP